MSSLAARVARMFGIEQPSQLPGPRQMRPPIDPAALIPCPGQIVLLCGGSGSGKSSLLRAVRREARRVADRSRWIDLPALAPPGDAMVVDCFRKTPLEQALAMLSRVGLAEVWTYLRPVEQLSDGQQWRLKLARAMAIATRISRAGNRRRAIIACDEFAAILDRITAAIVARCLRRLIDADLEARSDQAASAIVVTSHDDLIGPLAPDVVAWCDFEEVTVTCR